MVKARMRRHRECECIGGGVGEGEEVEENGGKAGARWGMWQGVIGQNKKIAYSQLLKNTFIIKDYVGRQKSISTM